MPKLCDFILVFYFNSEATHDYSQDMLIPVGSWILYGSAWAIISGVRGYNRIDHIQGICPIILALQSLYTLWFMKITLSLNQFIKSEE